MPKNLELSDPSFDELVTLREAYLTMVRFLEAYHRRGESLTGVLLSDIQIGLWKDQGSADPAQLYDFLDAVRSVKAGKA